MTGNEDAWKCIQCGKAGRAVISYCAECWGKIAERAEQRDELLKAAKAAVRVYTSLLSKDRCPDCEEDTALEMREILQAAIAKVEQKEA